MRPLRVIKRIRKTFNFNRNKQTAESATRSRTMRAIKSRDTQPEIAVQQLLRALGFRYRKHRKELPGSPDVVFSSLKKVIFVNGCFWHGHKCARGNRIPKTNRRYWVRKIARNVERDRKNVIDLRKLGWKALVVWECQIRRTPALTSKLKRFLNSK